MTSTAAGSQITFICENGHFKMPKETIRSQSKQLSLMMDTKTYEQKPRELIYLAGTTTDELEKLKLFFRTGSYIINTNNATNDATDKRLTIAEAIEMFVLGEKYGIGNLKEQAKGNLKGVLSPDWTTENFMFALERICTYLPSTTELKNMVLGQVATFELSVAMKLFEDYDVEGGFNDLCEKFREECVDIRRDLVVLQEEVLKEEEARHVGIPGLVCPVCKAVDVLQVMDSAKGRYFCTACKDLVNGKVPGEWIR